MGIYVNNQLVTVQNGAALNTQVSLGAGNRTLWWKSGITVAEPRYVPVNVTVQQLGTKLSSLQASSGWNSWGQGRPNYTDCSPSPCNGFQFSHVPNIASPSLSGKATAFTLGGLAALLPG